MPATSSFSIARFTAHMAWFQAFYKGREGLGWDYSKEVSLKACKPLVDLEIL